MYLAPGGAAGGAQTLPSAIPSRWHSQKPNSINIVKKIWQKSTSLTTENQLFLLRPWLAPSWPPWRWLGSRLYPRLPSDYTQSKVSQAKQARPSKPSQATQARQASQGYIAPHCLGLHAGVIRLSFDLKCSWLSAHFFQRGHCLLPEEL